MVFDVRAKAPTHKTDKVAVPELRAQRTRAFRGMVRDDFAH
jgi:hypothetical protein